MPFPGAGQQNDVVAVAPQPLGDLAVAAVAPMLGRSVEASRMNAERRTIEFDAERGEAAPGLFPKSDGQRDRWKLIDDAGRIHRRKKGRVVVELPTISLPVA